MLLLDMEMPDNCYTCPFCDYEQGKCMADGKKIKDGALVGFFTEGRYAGGNKEKRAGWCPIKGELADHDFEVLIKGRTVTMEVCYNYRGSNIDEEKAK